MFSVAIYLVDKAFVGPEEGGWWFDYGYPVTEVFEELEPEFRLPRYFDIENAAYVWARGVQVNLDATVNKSRRDISSMASEGQYFAIVEEGVKQPHSVGAATDAGDQ